ncbi:MULTISPECIES: dihydroorotate dehydrogenase [Peptoniphilus]|uniref:dihydroorotate dehydrogenase n=1 Tax=Peptoniphilus TaxID=162289 RepID=UPI0001DA9ACD|nr:MULTISPECIES: dihydroorotate dehydrogenase [Peptoniphilus]EFI42023.1 dihydroorotate dehydrogenase 1B [Peptoniphilus sp. oral taxon 386 str. F0131]
MNRLKTEILGVEFKNPIIPASGTYGFGEEYTKYYKPSILGGIASKGITYYPKSGNDGIRIWETPSGIMNSIGLENPGIHYFAENILGKMNTLETNVIVNLGGNTVEEYVEAAKILNDYEFFAIELNISCPNVKHGGMAFGIEADSAALVTEAVKKATRHRLIVKLSPNARDIVESAKAVEKAGADGISLVNTFLAMAIDAKTGKAVFNNTYAGLSGPAIKPIALRMTHQVCKNVSIPVIAMGGITNGMDAIEFIMAGASAIQVGTANFMNPNVILDIIDEMQEFLEEKNLRVDDIRAII